MGLPTFTQSTDIPVRNLVFTKAADYTAGAKDITRNGACPALIVAAANGTVVLVDVDGTTVTYPAELLDRPILGGAFKSISNTSTSTAISCGYNVTGGFPAS